MGISGVLFCLGAFFFSSHLSSKEKAAVPSITITKDMGTAEILAQYSDNGKNYFQSFYPDDNQREYALNLIGLKPEKEILTTVNKEKIDLSKIKKNTLITFSDALSTVSIDFRKAINQLSDARSDLNFVQVVIDDIQTKDMDWKADGNLEFVTTNSNKTAPLKAMENLNNPYIPSIIFINADGKISNFKVGSQSESSLEDAIVTAFEDNPIYTQPK